MEHNYQPMIKLKEAAVLFGIQLILYGLLCINFRAVSEAHYNLAAVSDFTIASLNFFVIRKIAKSEDSTPMVGLCCWISSRFVSRYLAISSACKSDLLVY
jgi:hypothetical protein